jgi:DNA-directed RNA polymerase specialized sigma24 family protein
MNKGVRGHLMVSRSEAKVEIQANFVGYTWKEEMVGNAVLKCFLRAASFDPEKGKFKSYFSVAIWHSFLDTIKKEKREFEKAVKAYDLGQHFLQTYKEPEPEAEQAA